MNQNREKFELHLQRNRIPVSMVTVELHFHGVGEVNKV